MSAQREDMEWKARVFLRGVVPVYVTVEVYDDGSGGLTGEVVSVNVMDDDLGPLGVVEVNRETNGLPYDDYAEVDRLGSAAKSIADVAEWPAWDWGW